MYNLRVFTHKGDTLLLIEVPLDSYDFEIIDTIADIFLFYIVGKERIRANYRTFDLQNNKYEIIGTTSTLTDKDVEPFIESKRIKESWNDTMTTVYLNYNNPNELIGKYVKLPLESWNSFLQHNGIDLTKNYCVLKLLNN
jgi:hypothetical protein